MPKAPRLLKPLVLLILVASVLLSIGVFLLESLVRRRRSR
jgi:hypothetical protein